MALNPHPGPTRSMSANDSTSRFAPPWERDRAAAGRFTRFVLAHPLLLGVLALLWLILQSGRKPSRLGYPCQQAALGSVAVLLGPTLTFAVAGAARRGILRWASVAVLGVSFMSLGLATRRDPGEVYAGMAAPHRSPSADYTAVIYSLEDAGGPQGTHHLGVDQLLTCMGADDFKFFRTPESGPVSGPGGVVGTDDVVLVKINSQWNQRGGTNTDVLKGIIARILEHPDGFTGEVVVVENTQGMGTLDWAEANAEDPSQSALDVVNLFAGQGHPVSAYLWDTIRTTSVQEYAAGDLQDGYVVEPWNPTTQIRVTYPKFRTAGGQYVSLKQGVWDPGSSSYDDSRLTFINVPVLKCHGAVYGVTATVKHHVGTMTTSLTSNTHYAVRYGGLGSFLADVRMPDLNILDCIYILARPSSGPWCSYGEATRVDRLVAGVDPVAIDLWATVNILVPAIMANGYSSWPMQDPFDSQSIFRIYLDNTTDALLAAGIQVTNDLAQIVAQTCSSAGIGSGEQAAVAPPAASAPSPNPFRSATTVRFDLARDARVELMIYDASGRLVRSIDATLGAGSGHELRWDGRDQRDQRVPAGTYYYRLEGVGAPTRGKVTVID